MICKSDAAIFLSQIIELCKQPFVLLIRLKISLSLDEDMEERI